MVINNSRKVAASVLALGAATSAVVFGSFAAWTATTTNPGNNVATATLTLTNTKAASHVLDVSNVRPGDSGSESVTIGNVGSVPLDLVLDQNSVVDAVPSGALQLQVFDGTNCLYPAATGACVAYGAWDASAGALNDAAAGSLAATGAGASKTFTIGYRLDASSDNGDQGKASSFNLTWTGTPSA